ncbi:VOC family protein [Couchioplanes caeruleus]|uniref:Glyoxalase-like domain-containing protein n=2 Tax=Couchioplanes caeruleus TaxID=56438 RepID=A0A1K0FMM5_9ACTN|nr:VOC family protein [Couchioplanes caeruleus]OJF14085.1 hypothetical protein BG844_11660 [Couchioplanes caeruleus subsp. caeruleus]ROP28355.1 glyoxalase-like protein [Couchioplanes caeruleus]
MTANGTEPILDHVVFAARSRDDAERALGETGLSVIAGRTMDGMGLSNVFIPLGSAMLEVHYPNGEPATAAGPPYAQIQRDALAAHPDVALLPVTWLVRFDDVERLREVSAADGCSVDEIPARGAVPEFLLGGFGPALTRPWLPALIHWPQPPGERLAARTAPHTRRPSGELTLDVSGPAEEITAWCGGPPRGVVVHRGSAGPLRVHVGLADGGIAILGQPTGNRS